MKFLKKLFVYFFFVALIGVTFGAWVRTNRSSYDMVAKRFRFTSDGTTGGTSVMDINSGGNVIVYGPLLDGLGNNYITGAPGSGYVPWSHIDTGFNYPTSDSIIPSEKAIVNYVSGSYSNLSGNNYYTGNQYFYGNVYFSGNNYFTGNNRYWGNNYFSGNQYFTGDNHYRGNQYYSGNNYYTGTNTYYGYTYFNNNLFISGNVIHTGNYYLFGNLYISGNIAITGTLTDGQGNPYLTGGSLSSIGMPIYTGGYYNTIGGETGLYIGNITSGGIFYTTGLGFPNGGMVDIYYVMISNGVNVAGFGVQISNDNSTWNDVFYETGVNSITYNSFRNKTISIGAGQYIRLMSEGAGVNTGSTYGYTDLIFRK